MGSCNAIFSLAYPLVSKVPYGTYEIQFPYLGRISIRSLLLALCCMGFTIFWAINRNAS